MIIFFFTFNYKYNKTFWIKFSKYIRDLTGDKKFDISVETIICGWNRHDSKFTFANVLIWISIICRILVKNNLLWNKKKQHLFILILFMLEIKRILAARLVFAVGRRIDAQPLLQTLHWLPIRQRIVFKVLLYMCTIKPSVTLLPHTLLNN